MLKTLLNKIVTKPFDSFLYLLALGLIVKLVGLYFQISPDDSHWNEFKAEHHCQLQVTERGSQRSGWLCDDGKTYYRWRQQR